MKKRAGCVCRRARILKSMEKSLLCSVRRHRLFFHFLSLPISWPVLTEPCSIFFFSFLIYPENQNMDLALTRARSVERNAYEWSVRILYHCTEYADYELVEWTSGWRRAMYWNNIPSFDFITSWFCFSHSRAQESSGNICGSGDVSQRISLLWSLRRLRPVAIQCGDF